MRVKSESANRSGIVTENMTSATPDQIVWTTFKNVQVNENGEFVVWPNWGWGWATNLTYTPSPTNGTVNSDTGTDATIPLADITNAGLISPAEKAKVWFISITQPVDLDTMEQDVADLTTLSWVASNAINLWTFTWTTIPDNSTVKQALQALETAVETKQQKIQIRDDWFNLWTLWEIDSLNFSPAWTVADFGSWDFSVFAWGWAWASNKNVLWFWTPATTWLLWTTDWDLYINLIPTGWTQITHYWYLWAWVSTL